MLYGMAFWRFSFVTLCLFLHCLIRLSILSLICVRILLLLLLPCLAAMAATMFEYYHVALGAIFW